MIRLEGINYSVNGKKILNDVNLNIVPGRVTVIFGPSGAGKSTLLRTMNLLTVPDEGTLTFGEGTDIERRIDAGKVSGDDKAFLRKNIGMVFQSYTLFENKTVLENIAEGLRIVHKKSVSEAEAAAVEALKKVRMDDRLQSYPSELSGGQRQRVSIARVLALKSRLTLMDEPTSALDGNLIKEVQQNVGQLVANGMTVVVVTHDVAFARNVGDDVYFIRDGAIVTGGSVEEMFDFAQL